MFTERYEWDDSKWIQVPKGYWEDMKNQRTFMEKVAKKLRIEKECSWLRCVDIKTVKDWYSVSVKQFHRAGGAGLLSSQYSGSLIRALQTIYPHVDWKAGRFSVAKTPHSKRQYLLFKHVQSVSTE